jgi:hypothetical protein
MLRQCSTALTGKFCAGSQTVPGHAGQNGLYVFRQNLLAPIAECPGLGGV